MVTQTSESQEPENKAPAVSHRSFAARGAVLLALMLALSGVLHVMPAFSQTRYNIAALLRCSHDDAILQAFHAMRESQGEASLSLIVSKPVRVIFKDMKTLNKALKNYDALSWLSSTGEQVIFINEKHRNAPPEALAAMIAHEAMHEDEANSLSEEVQSWAQEAKIWSEMKARNPALVQIKPGSIALVDRENQIEREYRQGTLEKFVRGRPGYQGLPESSPGFPEFSAAGQQPESKFPAVGQQPESAKTQNLN